ncbi:MAG: N-acetylneuraminate synthase family protein [Elusimicrobiota bacterium]
MNRKVKIGNRLVGDGEPVFIIAELGANHDGKLSQALELIDIAAESGADAVKLQLYYGSGLWPKSSKAYPILKSLETNRGWMDQLLEHARKRKIILFAAPFDKEAVDLLERYDTPVYKWASSEIFDIPLIKYAAAKKRPMIMSTGVCDLADVQRAVDAVQSANNENLILLHCVSSYPTKPEDTHLRMMETMRTAFQVPVGFSDHSLGIAIPIAAAARGACVIEKHFTLSHALEGLDHAFALEPDELKQMVKSIREVEKCLGSPIKTAVKGAEDTERIVRLFAAQDIPKGTELTKDLITVKREAFGIMPEHYEMVLGRETKGDIKADTPITWDLI